MFKFILLWVRTFKNYFQGDTFQDAYEAAVLTSSGFRRVILSKKLKRQPWRSK